jgi:hypothetical protein
MENHRSRVEEVCQDEKMGMQGGGALKGISLPTRKDAEYFLFSWMNMNEPGIFPKLFDMTIWGLGYAIVSWPRNRWECQWFNEMTVPK